MLSRYRVSRAAIELIKRFEGYRRKAAQLPDGRWTIGYGHTLTAREGAEVSEADAEALLVYDLIAVQHAVNESVLAPVSQNQFDALCSFAFNIGLDNFRRSQVLKRLNAGSTVQAACAMELWRKADFEGERIVVDALVRRRAAEKALFLTPAGDAWVPAPSPLLRPVIDLDALDLVPMRRPVGLETSFEGDKVEVRREDFLPDEPAEPAPPPAAAVTVAAEAVTGRLERIFAEPGEEPEPAPEPELDLEEVLRPQADFAPPITTAFDGVEPEAEGEPTAAPVSPEAEPELAVALPPEAEPVVVEAEPAAAEAEPEPEPQPEPVVAYVDPLIAVDTELEIPRAPVEDEAPEPPSADALAEAQPYEFIPARTRPAPKPKEPSVVWDLLLSLLGLAFFGFGVFWGLSAGGAPTGGPITPTMVAWPAGLAGVGFFVVAVYRLLQRLGREAEQD
ncbi:lysozyme [Phenylobacterium kunshanense]|nr:lysozyme [Phenylobacterium kunshanense]